MKSITLSEMLERRSRILYREQVVSIVSRWCILGLLFQFTTQVLAFEHLTYRYQVKEGKGVDVCQHMLKVYSARFTKLWSGDKASKQHSASNAYWKTIYSRQPSSAEYDAIKWNFHYYKRNGREEPVLHAEFDIDNDGTNELVLKTGFFYGSPGSWDYIEIYPAGSIDFSKFATRADYERNILPHRRAEIAYPLHQRLFIFRGTTFISGYVYTPREFRGANPSEPFAPPEFLLIRKYVGGPARDAVEQEKSMKPVCTFNMIQSIRR